MQFFKTDPKRVHFVGIGGIGVSALARYYLAQDYIVSGSDAVESELLEELRREGALIAVGHEKNNIRPGTDLVIYSAAVKNNNPELKAARELKIKTQTYAQALGDLTKRYFTIAVAGSHGKSTTTALLGLILIKAGLDPTVIVGTKLKEFKSSANSESGSNFRIGKSQYLVIEADEWNRSFHYYYPKIAVVTNIDKEHLDTYGNFRGVAAGFARYFKNIPQDGTLVLNYKDAELRKLGRKMEKGKSGKGIAVVFYNRNNFKKHPLLIPGRHNQINAEAAWQAFGVIAKNANLNQNNANLKETANYVFKNYTGAWRRLELLAAGPSLIHDSKFLIHIYSDYAHHPTEIKATLAALREKHPREQLLCVFEPHHQDRLTKLFKEFAVSFKQADAVVILPVYKVKGRDEADKGKNSFDLAQSMAERKSNVFYAPDFTSAIKTMRNFLNKNSVVVFMSAGGLDSQIRKFLVQ